MPSELSKKTAGLKRHAINQTHPVDNIVWASIAICFVISILDLAGWITGVDWLKSFGPYRAEMQAIVALCFILTSGALAIVFTKRSLAAKVIIPILFGVIVIFVSLLTIITDLQFVSSGSSDSGTSTFTHFIALLTNMPLLSACIFLVFGMILILMAVNKPLASNIAHSLCFLISVAGYMIPASYFLNVYSIHQFINGPVPLNSGIAFCMVSVAVFLMRPDTWLMRVFTSIDTGGIMARRMLPWFLLLPLAIGWLRIFGEHHGIFVSEVGVMLVAITYAFCFILLIWFTARSINLLDRKRHMADEALKKAYDELEDRVNQRTSELLSLNKVLDEEIKVRIKAEGLVKSERQRFNNLLELVPAYIILLTHDYHVAYSNHSFHERFGEPDDRHCYEFLFNRSTPCENCETYKILHDNKPRTWEWTGPDKHIYSVYDFPYADFDGSPLIMEMGIDITLLKQTEANLKSLNAELEHRVEERTNELRNTNESLDILLDISGRLLSSDNPKEQINTICLRVMKFLDCQVFFNFLTDESRERLRLNTYAGLSGKKAKEIQWLDFGEAVCGWVARDGTRIVAENISESEDPGISLVKSLGIKAYACHPLLSHDKVIGILSFGTKTRSKFSADDLSIMKSVTEQVAVALTRERDRDSLRKSEGRYRSLLELSPGASFVIRDNSITLFNSAARNLLGVKSVEEVFGKSPFDIFHADSHERFKNRMDRVLKGESTEMSVEQIIRADGAIRDVEVVSAGITDPDGPAIQVIMNDITERKRAEKELFDTKNYLEKLIDNANAPIIVWDQENKIRLFNHAFEHLTGYAASEVEGKKLDLLFPADTLEVSLNKIKMAVTENWKVIEIPILTRNKDTRIVLWNSAKIYDESRKTFSTIAQGNDITERIEAELAFKESKDKLEIALENGNIGTWEWDIGTGVFKLDERMEKIFGRKPGAFENTYEAFEKSIHEEDLPHVRNAFRKAIRDDMPLDTIYRIRHLNKDINYISTKALVERDNTRKPIKVSGVCFDITDMKRGAEEALFRINEELLRSNKDLEQFAYVASHDLQEPLRMISSFTQLLAKRYKDRLDQDAQEFIQFAVDGAVRMQVLINDLLDYSRIETRGKKFSSIDMQQVLGQVINNLNYKMQEKKALVTHDELPTIIADERQIISLLQNLIGNALKFCKKVPTIHISSRENEEFYFFSVKDNGIGIEAHYFDRIFQIFQRLHPREEYEGGTGIGLAISKRIVESHGGKIWVESAPDEGSIFYFTIKKV